MLNKIKQKIYRSPDVLKKRYLKFLCNYDKIDFEKKSALFSRTKYSIESEIRVLVHTIEKGMSLKSTKPCFGKEKVEKLLDLYTEYQSIENFDENVLYLIKCCIVTYTNFQKQFNMDLSFIPNEFKVFNEGLNGLTELVGYKRLKNNVSSNFNELAKERHSVRYYKDLIVTREDIEKVVQLAQTAPSACNRQAINIFATNNSDIIKKLKSIHGGLNGFENINVLFVVAGDLNYYLNEMERNIVFVDGGIFIMNLLYSMHHYNIGSCPIIWGSEPTNDSFVRNLFEIPERFKIVGLVVGGYYEDECKYACSTRKDIKDILFIKE